MKNLIMLSVMLMCIRVDALSQQESNGVASFQWLAGCWENRSENSSYVEIWMKPEGKLMLAMSRNVRKGKTIEYEFVRLVEEEDGSIYYVATPSGQEGAKFKLVKQEGMSVTFENPAHDFPQRIIYTRNADGSLLARIEGVRNGKERRVDFPLKRIACD